MDDYDTCYARARDEPAFSNGTEGYGWMGAWCDRCWYDKPAREERPEDGCPLLLVAYMQRTPAEWIPGDPCKPTGFSIPDQYTCVMFRHEDEGGDPEPRAVRTPPGQLGLFGREGLEGVRMLKALPAPIVRAVGDV